MNKHNNEILGVYRNAIRDLMDYEENTFTIHINIQVSKAFELNLNFHEEPTEYIKRYLLKHYFPRCYSMKIYDYSIWKIEGDLFSNLSCKVMFKTEEYVECMIICFQHFLVNPYWGSIKLKPIERKWHEGD